jgi:hypothetical protein
MMSRNIQFDLLKFESITVNERIQDVDEILSSNTIALTLEVQKDNHLESLESNIDL